MWYVCIICVRGAWNRSVESVIVYFLCGICMAFSWYCVCGMGLMCVCAMGVLCMVFMRCVCSKCDACMVFVCRLFCVL